MKTTIIYKDLDEATAEALYDEMHGHSVINRPTDGMGDIRESMISINRMLLASVATAKEIRDIEVQLRKLTHCYSVIIYCDEEEALSIMLSHSGGEIVKS